MSSKLLKQITVIVILLATISVFAVYISRHPEVFRQLSLISPITIATLLGLYTLFQVSLVWIQYETLQLCGIKLGRKESTLLVVYSAIINFFGPLQSGPAFRAAYLKRIHNVSLKRYAAATLLYYFFYGLFSALLLLPYAAGLWSLVCMPIVVLLVPVTYRKLYPRLPQQFQLDIKHVKQLAVATLSQVGLLVVIFHNELSDFGQNIAAVPTLIYTAAANFALFVSLTPGAIGFREAFLVFTGGLHNISNQTIISANVLDRGVYITFLGIMALITTGVHAKSYLDGQKAISDEKRLRSRVQ